MSNDHFKAVCIVFEGNPLGFVCWKFLDVPVASPDVQKKIGTSGLKVCVSIPIDPCPREQADPLGNPNDDWIAAAITAALEYDKKLRFHAALPR